jgi:malonate-semialdehyde dehydrogenase (acetylating)/methylmalonate-semialdehyde dehydrogenase
MQTLIRLQRYSFAVRTYYNFYGGQFVPSKATKFYEVYNPVTQEHIARSPQSSEEEFNAVIASAK